MKQIDQKACREYWEKNLDPQNLKDTTQARDLALEWELYNSDEQRFAQSRMPRLPGSRCLELGGGLGTHAIFLAQKGATVYVVDFSRPRLDVLSRLARELGLAERILCFNAAAESLPFPDDFFDLVYTKSVLIHTQLTPALKESRRILKRGGRAIFVEPSRQNPFAVLYRRLFAPKEWASFTRYFDAESAAEVLRVYPGAEVKFFYIFGFLAFIWNFKWPCLPLFKISLALSRLIDRPLLALCPALRKLGWFYVFVGTKND